MSRTQIYTDQVGDNSITTDDIKDGTIELEDLSTDAVGQFADLVAENVGLELSYTSIPNDKILFIKNNQQMAIHDSFSFNIDGDLIIDGELLLLN